MLVCPIVEEQNHHPVSQSIFVEPYPPLAKLPKKIPALFILHVKCPDFDIYHARMRNC